MDSYRHFSMSALSALIALRGYLKIHPDADSATAAITICRSNVDFAGADFEAALDLHGTLEPHIVFDNIQADLRTVLKLLILHHRPWWMRAVPYGRDRLASAIGRGADVGRNELQCLRSAGLFDEPPPDDAVAWWDELAHLVRASQDEQRLLQGRHAERLSLAYERNRLQGLGIEDEPRWISIEDNGAGYDIQSFDAGTHAPVNKLIEVKSSMQNPPKIFLTRNEWEAAVRYGDRYVFHIWEMSSCTLTECTVEEISKSIPADCGYGYWKEVEIHFER